MNLKNLAALALVAILSLFSTSLTAQDYKKHPKAIERFLTDDVVAVLYFDLDQLDLDVTIGLAKALGFDSSGQFKDIEAQAPMLKAEITKLKDAGISRAYGLLRTSDFQSLGTSYVIPIDESKTKNASTQLLESFKLISAAFGMDVTSRRSNPFNCWDAQSGVILISKETNQLKRLQKDRVETPRNFDGAWEKLGGGAVGLVVLGDPDSRKVVSQLLPELAMPLDLIDGNLIAEHIDWLGVELALGEKPNLKIEIQANTDDAAARVESTFVRLVDFLQQHPMVKEYVPESEMEFLLGALKPKKERQRVTVSIEELIADIPRFAKAVAPQVRLTRKAGAVRQKLNVLRKLALAMHNFESAHSHFPTQAIFDDNGNPLLSWRVQILPFLGEGELYKQFKLDQPWDSEHNLKLVKKMPLWFKDPSDGSHQRNKEGKTIFQVPVGEKTMFNGNTKIGFGEVVDGTSNTLLIATLKPEFGVPWTKPSDWQVDFEKPLEQLKFDGRTHVEAVLGDASVQQLSLKASVENWSNLIQHRDGNVVDGREFDK